MSSIDSNIERIVPIEYHDKPSIEEDPEIVQIDDVPSWIDLIFDYLTKGELPNDPLESRRINYQAARYLILNRTLCITPEEGEKVLRDIHERICGNHSGARSLAFKTLR